MLLNTSHVEICSILCIQFVRVPTVREKSLKSEKNQGQGKVREF